MRICFIIITLFLFGCEEKECGPSEDSCTCDVPLEQLTFFKNRFPDKAIDLTRKLGEYICLTDRQDTTCFKIAFGKASFNNYIIEEKYSDTIFAGKVYKDRGLYYFCRNISDTTFWITAVKINSDGIQGIEGERFQMHMIHNILDTSKTHPLNRMRDTLESPLNALTPDKKILAKFYKTIIDSFKVYKIIAPESSSLDMTKEEKGDERDSISRDNILPIINQFYPNPVKDVLNIETNLESEFEMNVLDSKGEVVMNENFSGNKKTINLTEVQAGIYFINLYSKELNRKEAFKIVVE